MTMHSQPDDVRDEQWSAIADYVSDQATPAAAAAMRTQVATDPTLAAQVAPLQTLWEFLAPNRIAAHLLANPSQPLAGEPALEINPDRDALRTATAWARLDAALGPSSSTPAASATLADPPQAPRQSRSIPRHLSARRPSPTLWWQRRWSIASGVALLLVLSVGIAFHNWRPAVQYLGGATGRVVTLPDSSLATLAPGAYLGTSHYYMSGIRAVYLFGQAHFQVSPDRAHPFVVHVLGVDATALGTTFGMTSDTTPRVTVDVTQGKVSLIVLGADGVRRPALVLTAGDVQHIPALTQWLNKVGEILGAAGVPFAETIRIHNTLIRAAAAAARGTAP